MSKVKQVTDNSASFRRFSYSDDGLTGTAVEWSDRMPRAIVTVVWVLTFAGLAQFLPGGNAAISTTRPPQSSMHLSPAATTPNNRAASSLNRVRASSLIKDATKTASLGMVIELRPNSFKVRIPCSPGYTAVSWLVRNNSASLRASIRSLLFPSCHRAFLRGSHTPSLLPWGFRRSCHQAAEVPSSNLSDRVPCSPWMNATIVAALVSSRHSMIRLP